jgi:predicted HNH restriction endonuclease
MINREKYIDCFDEYKRYLKSSKWISQELYKFEFAIWLNHNIDISKQTVNQLFEICKKSQEEQYSDENGSKSNELGIQFIRKGGTEKLSEYITIKDAEIFKFLYNNEYDKDTFSKRGISYTILSAWLGTIYPDRFVCVPAVDFVHSISFLFDFDFQKMPQRGFQYFEFGQEYFKIIKNELKQENFIEFFLSEINKYRKSLKINEKSNYDECDWNWITEDFNLFIFRNYLNLYQKKLKKKEKEQKQRENQSTTNKIRLTDYNNDFILPQLETDEDELRIIDNKADEFIELSDVEIIELIDEENVDNLEEIRKIEEKYKNVKPNVKEIISKRIERGNFADKIKKLNNYKCLICERLNKPPYVFKKDNGDYYIEVHHIIPVSELQIGSLSTANLITVCPNHHRQIHYGKFEIVENNELRFIFRIDNQLIHVNKPKIS